LYKVKGQVLITDRDPAIKSKGAGLQRLNHTVLSLGKLAQEGGSPRNHTIPDLGALLQGRGSLTGEPYYSSPWWTYTRGVHSGTKLPPLLVYHFKGEVH